MGSIVDTTIRARARAQVRGRHASSRALRTRLLAACIGVGIQALAASPACAEDAQWRQDASEGGLIRGTLDYNAGANWSNGVVPDGVATFGPADNPNISFTREWDPINVGEWHFTADAPDYRFTLTWLYGQGIGQNRLHFRGAGITGNSKNVTIDNELGFIGFYGNSTAGEATIINRRELYFYGNSSAAQAHIINDSAVVNLSRMSARELEIGAMDDVVDPNQGASWINMGAHTLILGGLNRDMHIDGQIDDTVQCPSGTCNGGGTLVKVGTGVLTLTDKLSNWSGGTEIRGGMISLDPGVWPNGQPTVGVLGASPITINGGALRAGANMTLDQAIITETGGSAELVAKPGTALRLNGFGNVAGGHAAGRISFKGNIEVGGDGSEGVTVEDGTVLDLSQASLVADGNVLGQITGGNGDITRDVTVDLGAGGRLTFRGNQPATINNLLGANGSAVANGSARLTVGAGDHAGSLDIGSLAKEGAGTLALSGTNAYRGETAVRGGTLLVNGNQSNATGDTVVAGGAVLGGSGTIGGDVTVGDGATLAPGAASGEAGTLTIRGDLRLSEASVLDYQLGQAEVAGGALNDLVRVGGDLVLDGALDISLTPGGLFTAGVYRLFDYEGSLTDQGLEIRTAPVDPANLTVVTAVDHQVDLFNSTGLGAFSFWDGPDDGTSANNGTIEGGSGTWQLGGTLDAWANEDGSVNGPYVEDSFAIFQGTGGTVSIDNGNGAVTATGMQFAADGYEITGDTLTLTGDDALVRVGDGSAAGADYTATIATELGGHANLVKSDLGTLLLTQANSYTGQTIIQGGTVALAGSGSIAGSSAVVTATGGTFDISGVSDGATIGDLAGVEGGHVRLGGQTLTITGGGVTRSDIGDGGMTAGTGGSLLVDGGSPTLAGVNTYTGSTTIRNGGTLTLADAGSIAGSSLVQLDGADTTFDISATAAGAAVKALAGDGDVLVGSRILTITDASPDATMPAIFSGVIADGGSGGGTGGGLTLAGGALRLSGQNTYTGLTTVGAAGHLELAGSIAGDLLNEGNAVLQAGSVGGNLTNDGSFLIGDGGRIAGAATNNGTMEVSGDGTIAGVLVNEGVVSLASSLAVGGLEGTAQDAYLDIGGTLAFGADGADRTYAGLLTGAGVARKTGTGTQVLDGANSSTAGVFTGSFQLDDGAVLVNGTLGGSDADGNRGTVTVASGALLGGSGTVDSDVTVADGGILAAGGSADAVGTLTIGGDLTLSGGSVLEYQLGEADAVGGPSNDLIEVGGQLVLDGTLNVSETATGAFGPGTYRLFNYQGELIDNGLEIGDTPNGGDGFIVLTSIDHQVDLFNPGRGEFGFWDGPDDGASGNNGVIEGGSGTWQLGGALDAWTTPDGSVNGAYANGGFAVFQGAAGVVRVDNGNGAVGASGMQFATDGYEISGHPLTLGGSLAVVRVGDGTAAGADYTATISANLVGDARLVKTDLGTLVLNGNNTYSGGTQVEHGRLQLGPSGSLGYGGLQIASAGTVDLGGRFVSVTELEGEAGSVITNSSGVVSTLDVSGEGTFAGIIEGEIALNRGGSGVLTLAGANTYTSSTGIGSDSTLALAGAGSIAGSSFIFNQGTFDISQTDAGATVRNMLASGITALGSKTLTVTEGGTIGGTIADGGIGGGSGGGLTVAGETLTLVGANTYTGATRVEAGTLALKGSGSIADSSGVQVDPGAVFDISQAADGASIATLSGEGEIALGGSTLTVTDARGLFAGTIADGGIAGGAGGGLDLDGGMLVLSGDNTFTGATNVRGGTLLVNGNQEAATGSTSVDDGAVLGGAGVIGGDVAMAGGSTLSPGGSADAAGTLTIKGSLSLSEGTALQFQLGEAYEPGGALNDLVEVGGNLVLDGTLHVSETTGGAFGPGIYRLFDYGGDLTDRGLDIGNAPGDGSGLIVQTGLDHQVNLVNTSGLTLRFWDGPDHGYNDAIDGGSGTWQVGGPPYAWTDANGRINGAYTDGSFAVFQGTPGLVTVEGPVTTSGMQFASNGYRIDGDALGLVGEQAIIRVGNGADEGADYIATVQAPLTGDAQLVKTDLGILELGAANTYAGGTRIEAGTLRLVEDGSLGNGGLEIAAGGSLDLGGRPALVDTLEGEAGSRITNSAAEPGLLVVAGGGTFGGTIDGDTGLEVGGSGTLTLTGGNTHTGDTTIASGGTLALAGSGSAGGSSVTVAAGGVFDISQADDGAAIAGLGGAGQVYLGSKALTISGTALVPFSGTIADGGIGAGAGGGINVVDGTVWLEGTNTYTGWTNLGGSTLVLGGTGSIAQSAGLHLDASSLFDIAGTDAGATLATLSGDGTVELGDRTLTITDASTTFAGTISDGSGSGGNGGDLVLEGGTLLLTGDNTFTGLASVGAGARLQVDGSLAGGAYVARGGMLNGNGWIGGDVTVDGAISAGASPGVMGIGGDLLLNPGSTSLFEMGSPGVIGNGTPQADNDFISVGGDLTLDGRLNLRAADGGQITSGYYTLYEVSGSVDKAGDARDGFDVIDSGRLSAEIIETGKAGSTFIDVVVGAGQQKLQFWDGEDLQGNGVVDGGSGTWNAVDTNWTTMSGDDNDPWVSQVGIFQGSAGTVTVDDGAGPVSFSGLQFKTDGYLIEGKPLVMSGDGAPGGNADASFITVDNGATVEIAANLTGVGLDKTVGGGTLVLSGDNGYVGTTTLASGTLRAGSATALGDAGNTTIVRAGGALDLGGWAIAQSRVELADSGIIGNGMLEVAGSFEQRGGTMSAETHVPVYALSGGLMSGTVEADTYTQAGGETAGAVTAMHLLDLRDGLVSGQLSGAARLVKSGEGTVTLTGSNSYAGGTRVLAGTLVGDTDAIRGDIAIEGGTVVIDQGEDADYAGHVSGSGGLVKRGAARLSLGADSSAFSGRTTVEAGVLAVEGALGGALDVHSGARLEGTGSVGTTTLARGATIAPGGSIGTLTVDGDITFAAGSGYEVEVDPAGTASDLVHATGRALLMGGSVMHIGHGGNYRPGAVYTILSADEGVSGTFGNVHSSFAFLDPTLHYEADRVLLQLLRNDVGFHDLDGTFNQRNTGSGVGSLDSGNPIWDAVVVLDAPSALAAFDSLSGEVHVSAKGMLMDDSRFLREASIDRVRGAFGDRVASARTMAQGAGGAAADSEGATYWVRGFGSWGEWAGDGNAATFDRSAGGLFMGTDASLADNLRIGLVGGYGRTSFDVDRRASSGSSRDLHFGVYGGSQWGAFGLRFGAGYSRHDIETRREAAFSGFSEQLRGDYGGRTKQVFAEGAYRIHATRVSFEPFLELAYVQVETDDFMEDGGTAALAAAEGDNEVALTTVGLRASTGFAMRGSRWTAHGSLGLRRAFGDATPLSDFAFAGSRTFTIAGVPIGKEAAAIELGLQGAIGDHAKLGLAYSGWVARDGTADGGLQLDFSVGF